MNNLVKTMAHRYLALGWCVIPIWPKTKKPAIDSWREYQKRLPTPEELDKWFDNPKMNIALITGSVSKVSVIDGDGPAGIKSIHDAKLTATVQAVTGKGKHLLYADPEGKARNFVKRLPGLDARGEGGYILVYPSIHENGKQYKWIGAFNVDLLPFPEEFVQDKAKSITNGHTGQVISDTPNTLTQTQRLQMLEKALPLLKIERCDNYDYWIKVGMALKEFGLVGYRLWDGWSKQSSKYSAPILAEKWGTFNDESGITIGSIIHWAREDSGQTIRPEPSQSQPSNRQSSDTDKAVIWTPKSPKSITEEPIGTAISTGIKQLDQKLRGGYRQGYVYAVHGVTNSGKSTFLVQTARVSCDSGKRVLFITTEATEQEIEARYLANGTGLSSIEIEHPSSQEVSRQLADYRSKFTEHLLGVHYTTSPDVKVITKLIEDFKPELIVWDYYQHFHTGSEMRYNMLAEYARWMESAAIKYNVPIVIGSQLHLRKDFKTKQKLPSSMTDVKDCAIINDTAKVVMVIDWNTLDLNGDNTTDVELRLEKNKGEVGTVFLSLNRAVPKFTEVIPS